MKKILNHILFLSVFMLSVSSSFGQKHSRDKIIFLNDHYSNFVNAVKKDAGSQNAAYQETVQTPIFKTHFSASDYAFVVNSNLATPIRNISGLQGTLDRIKTHEGSIKENVLSALRDSRKLLKSGDQFIYILPANPDSRFLMEKMGGVMGLTAGRNQILLYVEPEIKGWETMLKYAVAHEYNHVYWTQRNIGKANSWTLLDFMVFEGRGDSFAHLLYPKVKPAWTNALSDDDKTVLWNKLKDKVSLTDPSFHLEVLFGSRNYPNWGGYTLGYDIVQNYLANHKSANVEKWADLDAKEILSLSSFK